MKKYKLLSVLLGGMLLSGCEQYEQDITQHFVLPPELSACTIHELSNGFKLLYVVHCPNKTTSSATYQEGKSSRTVAIVTDGM